MIPYGRHPKLRSCRTCWCEHCCYPPEKGRARRESKREIKRQIADEEQEPYESEDPALAAVEVEKPMSAARHAGRRRYVPVYLPPTSSSSPWSPNEASSKASQNPWLLNRHPSHVSGPASVGIAMICISHSSPSRNSPNRVKPNLLSPASSWRSNCSARSHAHCRVEISTHRAVGHSGFPSRSRCSRGVSLPFSKVHVCIHPSIAPRTITVEAIGKELK